MYGPLQYIIGFAAASNIGQLFRYDLETGHFEPISDLLDLT